MASRDSQKTKDAVERIKNETGKSNLEVLPVDLADLHGVRKAAEEFLAYVPDQIRFRSMLL
jgi:hypothetical protein